MDISEGAAPAATSEPNTAAPVPTMTDAVTAADSSMPATPPATTTEPATETAAESAVADPAAADARARTGTTSAEQAGSPVSPRSRTTSSEAPPPDPVALATHAASLVQSSSGYKELPGRDQTDVLVNLSEALLKDHSAHRLMSPGQQELVQQHMLGLLVEGARARGAMRAARASSGLLLTDGVSVTGRSTSGGTGGGGPSGLRLLLAPPLAAARVAPSAMAVLLHRKSGSGGGGRTRSKESSGDVATSGDQLPGTIPSGLKRASTNTSVTGGGAGSGPACGGRWSAFPACCCGPRGKAGSLAAATAQQ